MTSTNTLKTAFVVEPNPDLSSFYRNLGQLFKLSITSSVPQALQKLSSQKPEVFILSTSFASSLQVQLLEAFKNACKNQIIPLILVVDLNQPLSAIAGTSWGGKLRIVHSQQSLKELKQTLKPLL